MLLMVGSVFADENSNYKKLREEGLSRIRKPWNVESLTVDDVKEILGTDYEKSTNEVLIVIQICHLLAQNTDGNPRKIKRFVNMLLLRYEIAKNRGFGDELELAILAKMMLAEYYETDFYKELSIEARENLKEKMNAISYLYYIGHSSYFAPFILLHELSHFLYDEYAIAEIEEISRT